MNQQDIQILIDFNHPTKWIAIIKSLKFLNNSDEGQKILADIEKYPSTDKHMREKPDLYKWNKFGYECMIMRSDSKHWCGYVTVPYYHPYNGKKDIDVHGGITFWGSKGPESRTYGFHCLHVPDIVLDPFTLEIQLENEDLSYKDYQFIVDETNKLAKILNDMGNRDSNKTNEDSDINNDEDSD